MDPFWKDLLWNQAGAAIDMLENAIRGCPDELWSAALWDDPHSPRGFAEFWYIAFHTLFWLDLYTYGAVDGFAPPAPFTMDELHPAGLLPERQYTQAELLAYLARNRQKCQDVITGLTDEQARRRCAFSWGETSFAELLVYTMRHVQEHAAQLALVLGQQRGAQNRWVAQAKRAPAVGSESGPAQP
jgi:hypothetical protein